MQTRMLLRLQYHDRRSHFQGHSELLSGCSELVGPKVDPRKDTSRLMIPIVQINLIKCFCMVISRGRERHSGSVQSKMPITHSPSNNYWIWIVVLAVIITIMVIAFLTITRARSKEKQPTPPQIPPKP